MIASIATSDNGEIPSMPPSIVKYVPKPPPSPKTHPKKAKAVEEVVLIQDCLMADITNPKTLAAAKAQCARAWDVLEDRKRILRGKGLPRPVEPREKPKAKQPRASFTEGPEVPKVPATPQG